MAAPKKKTKAAPPSTEKKSVIFRLSPRAAAKIAKLPKGTRSETVSSLIEQGL